MANLMLYAKGKGDARFGAVDMANGAFPVPLMYATLVPEVKLETLKQRAGLLNRMRQDCLYFLSYGRRDPRYLWANDAVEQLAYMKAVWNSFPSDGKPEMDDNGRNPVTGKTDARRRCAC